MTVNLMTAVKFSAFAYRIYSHFIVSFLVAQNFNLCLAHNILKQINSNIFHGESNIPLIIKST